MVLYKIGFEGTAAKYWKKYLLSEDRDIRVHFLQRFLKEGVVLDLGCGPGKHSAYFSKAQGVMGLDLSKDLLTKAKEECKKKGNYERVDLVRGDMRCPPFRPDAFDNVVHIQAFGYFSDADNESVIAEIVRILKRGGTYIYQSYNRPKSSRPLEWKTLRLKEAKGILKTQKIKYDPETKRLYDKKTIEGKDSKEKVLHCETRLYSLRELKRLFREKGLKINTVFGSIVSKEFWDELDIEEFDDKKEGPMTIVSEKT